MTRDDFVRMAREAGILNAWDLNWHDRALEKFAVLIADAEREACATMCDLDMHRANEWLPEVYVGKYYGKLIRARASMSMFEPPEDWWKALKWKTATAGFNEEQINKAFDEEYVKYKEAFPHDYVMPIDRNDVLEEVAKEFDKMTPFGDTAQSFATFVRGMKS